MKSITIYNDGEVAVQYLGDDGVGSIQRVHGTLEQATREQFLADLPVDQPFLDEVKQDSESWKAVQTDIAETLKGRNS